MTAYFTEKCDKYKNFKGATVVLASRSVSDMTTAKVENEAVASWCKVASSATKLLVGNMFVTLKSYRNAT